LLFHYQGALARIADNAEPPEPRWGQDWFPALDAAMLYAMIRHYRPRRIIEIGSGHSTRFAARAVRDEGLATTLLAIDPAPRASLARLSGQVQHLPHRLEECDLALFSQLEARDILFIDSSHILMPGSDVDILLHIILPALAPGVLVHFHDIFLPDSYPAGWRWRGYNESQALGTLLIGTQWSPLFSSHALGYLGLTTLPPALAGRPHGLASSLWLERAS
jgi:predicted O-methyltransferase YrrM